MTAYRANLRDLQFNLFEARNAIDPFGQAPWTDFDPATTRTILAEVAALAEGPIHASFIVADHAHPTFDPDAHSVTLPAEFKDSYRALMDAEWWRLDLPESLGGASAPAMLRWAVAEMILGANPAVFLYMAGPLFAAVLDQIGTPDQRLLAHLMVEHQWGATMVLTEPDAGSDVGAGRAKAVPQPDGSWHLDGVKRFITSGDQDLSDNIIHFVLARPEGVEGAGGPGTKGLSLFIVPKFHADLHTGALGNRNGVYVTNVEDKMGLVASATCEVAFGQHGTPAVGWLVGDRHTGIADMFRIIEWARMMVGTKAMATLGYGYQIARDYALTRVQGPDLTRSADKTAPRVPIVDHPDVRRMLMLQKSYAEGLRALVLHTASWQDRAVALDAGATDPDGLTAAQVHAVNDLLLPVVKGVGSERATEMLNLSLQVLGGSGYLRDYPCERLIRDAVIDRLYEGTTGIQSMDFLFRKILKDQGSALTVIKTKIESAAKAGTPAFETEWAAVTDALATVQRMLGLLTEWTIGSLADPALIYRTGEQTVRLLMAAGDVVIAWLLLAHAEIAQIALDAGATGADRDFYIGKVASARFFTRTVLPRLDADLTAMQATDGALMATPVSAL